MYSSIADHQKAKGKYSVIGKGMYFRASESKSADEHKWTKKPFISFIFTLESPMKGHKPKRERRPPKGR